MKHIIRLTESQLHRLVQESINGIVSEGCNEMAQVPTASLKGQDTIQKMQALVDQANQAYQSLASEYGAYSLMDREGDPYSLKGQIKLHGNGFIVFPLESGTQKMKVFTKSGGRIRIFPGDWYTEGWKDAKKLLNKIIKDAEIGRRHIEIYDPSVEDDVTPENYKEKRQQQREMNKRIGIKADSHLIERP